MTTLPHRQQLLNILIAHYDKGEAQAIARLYLERRFDLSHTDALLGKHFLLTPLHEQQWATDLEAFRRGVPVQYVLGSAEFDGHAFAVTPDVLIPRPETEGLVQWAAELASDQPAHLLDAGTGSGCIAVSLALRLPSATLTAWDISEAALAVARCNAKALGAGVAFLHRNIMTEAQCPTDAPASFHFIVSNPPYIRRSEAVTMERHVLHHEPHSALFVPDYDPLQFYRALALLSRHLLHPGGALLVETHRDHARQVAQLFDLMGYTHIEERPDCFGQPRFVKAVHP